MYFINLSATILPCSKKSKLDFIIIGEERIRFGERMCGFQFYLHGRHLQQQSPSLVPLDGDSYMDWTTL